MPEDISALWNRWYIKGAVKRSKIVESGAGGDFVRREFLPCSFCNLSLKTDSFHEILASYRNRNVMLIGGGSFSVETEMAWELRPPPVCFDRIPLRKVVKAVCFKSKSKSLSKT